MSSIQANLGRSSSDERLALLLKICNVKEHLRNNNKIELRDISSVTGGDSKHHASFEVTVKQWLEEFKTAISRIALSSGFRSTGLTAALTHNSFVASTGGIANGICFDELADFSDPTGVLSGPIEVVAQKLAELTSVSGSSSLSKIRADNFSRRSAIENELSLGAASTTRFSRGEKTVCGSDVTGGNKFGVNNTFTNASDQVPKADPTARSTLVGPRLVYPFKASDELTIQVHGGVSRVLTTGDPSTTTLVTHRYVVLGKIGTAAADVTAGALGGFAQSANATTAYMNAPTDVCVCAVSDEDLVKLQSGPVRVGEGVGAGTATIKTIVQNRMPGTFPGYYGMEKNSVVMIPISGLDDVDGSKVHGREVEGMTSQLQHASLNPTQTTLASVGSRMDMNSGHSTYIDVNRYVKLAKKYNDTNYDVIMIMDLTSMLEDGGLGGVEKGANDISMIHTHSLTGHATVSAPRESLLAIVYDDDVTPNVLSTRTAWQDSNIVNLVRGYDAFSKRNGGEQIVNRALSETISSSVRNDSYVLNDTFKTTLQIDGLTENPTPDQIYERLQDQDIVGAYADGLDANMWIGPDEGADRLRVLTKDGKLSVFKKWMRVMDYLTLIAQMTIDYSDGLQKQ